MKTRIYAAPTVKGLNSQIWESHKWALISGEKDNDVYAETCSMQK